MAILNADVRPAQTRSTEIESILTERSVFLAGSAGSHPATHAAVCAAVSGNRPIEIVLPAFPAKSGNRRKTLSRLPDMGEYLALSYLDELCRRIADIHAPGAMVRICSDGHVFSDLVGITDDDVDAYGEALAAIIAEEELTNLTTFALKNYYGNTNVASMRALLVSEFAVSLENLKQETVNDPDRQAVFNGIHRFLFEDALALNPDWSRTRVRNESKKTAYEVIRRSDAWSSLVAHEFPGAIRLSIHPHTRSTSKLGIKLMDGGGPWATPWHNAVIRIGDAYQLIRRQEAEALGARLKFAGGKYAYFEL